MSRRADLDARIRALHADWLPVLGLAGCRDLSGVEALLLAAPGDDAEASDDGWEYQRIAVRYSPSLARLDDDELEETVVHELTHALLEPLRRLSRSLAEQVAGGPDGPLADALSLIDERVTTEIARALIRAKRGT